MRCGTVWRADLLVKVDAGLMTGGGSEARSAVSDLVVVGGKQCARAVDIV
jgi:hypothetical protein